MGTEAKDDLEQESFDSNVNWVRSLHSKLPVYKLSEYQTSTFPKG